jgi:hypothetical protein
MDCQTFQKNLEDYLGNGLDFAGRFGMERHAQQCIACGKEIAGAQRLGRLVHELERVKAPPSFESRVIDEIGRRKLNSRFFRIRRNWIYGLETQPWRKWVPIAATLAVFGLGFLYWFNRAIPHQVQEPSWVAGRPANTDEPIPDSSAAKPPTPMETLNAAKETRPSAFAQEELFADQEDLDAEYIEFSIVGPDNLPATIQLPKKIRMHYGQPSEEYFIQNVSH